jgi:uncharacterized membrane protein YdbT with pleckstrin-like domain
MEATAMAETVIHPSTKLIRAAYTAVFIVLFFCVLIWVNWDPARQWPAWLLILPALLLLFPMKRHIERRFTRMIIHEDKLRYETGVLSRTTRNLQMSKIQDVRVDQSLLQRMLRTGNLSIETAGESGMLTMGNVDDPHEVADEILKASGRFQKGKSA